MPWLQGVDDEDEPRGVSARRMVAALTLVVLAAAIVAGTFFWLGRSRSAGPNGAPELIRADSGPYKIKSNDPGSLDVAGESETAFETSAGQDTDAQLDTSKLPQQPAVPVETTPAKPEPTAVKPAQPAAAADNAEAPAAASGTVVQLGAFANAAQAERAWTSLSSRFPGVAALRKTVVPFSGGMRLRGVAGSPSEAKQACQSLKAAGENCFVAN